MVKTVSWNKRALDDFYGIANYLEENYSKKAADNFVNSVFDKIDTLKKYPTIGRKAPKRKNNSFCCCWETSKDILSNTWSKIDNFQSF